MNTTKTFLHAAGLGLALTAVCVGPAQASGHDSGHDSRHSGHKRVHSDYGHFYTTPGYRLPGRGCFNFGDTSASAVAAGSPGLLSGNVIQAPISMPINLCGNSIGIGAIGDGAGGGNDGGGGGGNN